MSADYRPQEIEPKWQARWQEARCFEIDRPGTRPKHYLLEMLPYPSGRLHMGHVRNYTMGDVVARQRRMKGDAVLHPLGWDSLGLPAENAAIAHGADPREWTVSNIEAMRSQLKRLGLAIDWSREIASHEPAYYRWNQWFFLRFLEHDLAYRKKRAVHWCGSCNTVLANEQVEEGHCYRCETEVEARELEQWFLRTTRFQDELLAGLENLPGWPEAVRKRQAHWIGRSEGAQVRFPVRGTDESVAIFTTRIDTIFGCTFVVLAPDHPLLDRIGIPEDARARIAAFAEEVAQDTVAERGEEREKRGLPTGAVATNPFTGEEIPIWAANFVVKDYGTGAVMAVPAHDLRDHEFASREGLPIRKVIAPVEGGAGDASEATSDAGGSQASEAGEAGADCFTEDGVLHDSGDFSGQSSAAAREAMIAAGLAGGFAEAATQHRLRDWGISRQRFWGTPIPIIHCSACGPVPVPDEELPVELPERIELSGEASPLARHEAFARAPCPRCGAPARRDPDTMDTFVDSAWYFYRYLDPANETAPFSAEAVKDWMPIDLYIGGPEHAVGHLIYCRWWSRAMRAIGLEVPEEPIRRLIHHGMMSMATLRCPEHGWRYPEEVEEGHCKVCRAEVEVGDVIKMSKSKRNVVEPDHYVQAVGADALRLFVMFSRPGKELDWSDSGVDGMWRFLGRVWRMATREGLAEVPVAAPSTTPEGEALEAIRHRTIHRVSIDVGERLHFNTGISALMELTNALHAAAPVGEPLPADAGALRRAIEDLLRMLTPYAPHVAEEIWERLGHETLICDEAWPVADPAFLTDDIVSVSIQVNGKMRGRVEVPRDADQDTLLEAARAEERIAAHLEGREVKKLIHVPNRLLNVVAR